MPKKKKSTVGSKRKYHYVRPKTPTVNLTDHSYFAPTSTDTEGVAILNPQTNSKVACMDEDEPILVQDVELCHEVTCSTIPSEYDTLKDSLKELDWQPYQLVQTSQIIRFVEFYNTEFSSVKLSLCITEDFTPEIYVHNVPLTDDHDIWGSLPRTLKTVDEIALFLKVLQKYEVCAANYDSDFQNLTSEFSALTNPRSLQISAYREGDIGAICNTLRYKSTIRASNCHFLCLKALSSIVPRCKPCSAYRGTLRSIRAREYQKDEKINAVSLSSRKPMATMSKGELIQKCHKYRIYCNKLKLNIEKLKSKIKTEISTIGTDLSDKDSQDLLDMVETSEDEIRKAFPDEDSFQRLFWEEQKKYNSLKNKKQMRWHPMIIKWCLFLRHKSATTYSTLRDIGFVNLPSTRTLYDYSHCIKSGTGFRAEITNQLITEIHSKSFTDNWQQYVGLLHDEIKIKADLVYNKHSGELIGFMNLDDVGNAVLNMEQNMDEQRPQELAKYVLVLFVRGIATDLQFPLAHFATGGISADILYPIIWEALEILEVTVGLKVLFITCDGASPNRRFFKLHQLPQQINDSTVYCTDNPFAVGENRYLFFISDVPHLIKTTRNCFANSYSHKKTRKLWNEKDVSWMQIVDLYEECTLGIYNLCPKLTRSHIDLTAYSCMKVRLATQVLSDTVAFALCQLRGDEIGATVKFIRKMNTFFDCLNTRNLYEGRNTRNPNLAPYTAIDDARLTWLIDDFLKYFDDWKVAVENRPGQFSKSEKSAMMLSYQTLEGFQITAKSIVACVKYMLNLGTPFILTEVFNQDVLEQHFGHHRGRCGSNTNPTLSDMDNNMTHLRVIGSQAVSGASGNTRQFNRNRTIDNTPLLRRPRNN